MDANEKTYWSPAQFAVIQLELDEYRDFLSFEAEYQLTQESLRIDIVVIKKNKDVIIEKNIGRIFRAHNLIEFKSENDYISINDFYKVNAYSLHYMSLENIHPKDLTLTFITRTHPQVLFNTLKDELGCEVAEVSCGIYHVLGFGLVPVQVIETKLLDADENLWLGSLTSKIRDKTVVEKILTKYQEKGKDVSYHTYLSTLLKANYGTFLEVIESMHDEAKMWEDVEKFLARIGLLEKTKKSMAMEIAENLLSKGMQVTDIVDVTGLSMAEIEVLRTSH